MLLVQDCEVEYVTLGVIMMILLIRFSACDSSDGNMKDSTVKGYIVYITYPLSVI